eukprot:5125462-Lingulodinium_polyedra.AAC.1
MMPVRARAYCTACSCSEVSHIALQEFEAVLFTRCVRHSFSQVCGRASNAIFHVWRVEMVPGLGCCLFGGFK